MTSITRFLTRRTLLINGLVWTVSFVIIMAGVWFELMTDLDKRLQDRAESISILVEVEADGSLSMDYIDSFIEDFSTGGDSFFQIWDETGETFIKSSSLATMELPVQPIQDKPVRWTHIRLPNGLRGRLTWMTFHPRYYWDEIGSDSESPDGFHEMDRKPPITVTAAVAIPLEPVHSMLRMLILWMIGVGVLAMASIIFTTRRTIKQGLHPLEKLGLVARSIDVRNPDALFPDVGPSELKIIVQRLNGLLERTRSTFEREQLFAANVVHDLRTPVAELRTIMEVTKRYSWDDTASIQRAVDQGLHVALDLERLLHSLIDLLRCQVGDNPSYAPADAEICPWELVHQLIPQYHHATSQSRSWDWTGPEAFHITTSKALYETVLRQLLNNAAVHAPLDSSISIELEPAPQEGTVRLLVRNKNPGLTQEEIPHLFEPFWCASQHRSSHGQSGLGLSIAMAATQKLAGKLTACIEQENIVFQLEVPVSQASISADPS